MPAWSKSRSLGPNGFVRNVGRTGFPRYRLSVPERGTNLGAGRPVAGLGASTAGRSVALPRGVTGRFFGGISIVRPRGSTSASGNVSRFKSWISFARSESPKYRCAIRDKVSPLTIVCVRGGAKGLSASEESDARLDDPAFVDDVRPRTSSPKGASSKLDNFGSGGAIRRSNVEGNFGGDRSLSAGGVVKGACPGTSAVGESPFDGAVPFVVRWCLDPGIGTPCFPLRSAWPTPPSPGVELKMTSESSESMSRISSPRRRNSRAKQTPTTRTPVTTSVFFSTSIGRASNLQKKGKFLL